MAGKDEKEISLDFPLFGAAHSCIKLSEDLVEFAGKKFMGSGLGRDWMCGGKASTLRGFSSHSDLF